MASTVASTTLSFGLVSAPIKLKKASGKKGTEINSATPKEHHPAGYVYADKAKVEEVVGPVISGIKVALDDADKLALADAVLAIPFEQGDKGKPVQRPVKGVFDHGTFTEIPQDALDAIDEQCKLPDITIDGFVPLASVPFERAKGCYYIAPSGGPASTKPLVLLREAMKSSAVAGFGKMTLRTEQYAFVVYEKNGGLLVNTIEYAEFFAQSDEAADALAGVEADEKNVALAATLIGQLTVDPANIDGITNERFAKREELIAQALAGEKIEAPEKVEAEIPTDTLENLLLASISEVAPKPKKTTKGSKAKLTPVA